MEKKLSAVISGSFKYKPEIDAAIDVFAEHGVEVLEPTKGWLILPQGDLATLARQGRLRPLPTEEALGTREIEERFLRALKRADFMYIMNIEDYVGSSTAFEIGYSLLWETPLYAHRALDTEQMEIDDMQMKQMLRESVTVLPPEDVVGHYQATRRSSA